jgi:8-oxo-dGTP pyrophosphatase MutT (NUDIX family)
MAIRRGTKTIRYQYGCLPVRRLDDGAPLVLLVTSRETRRWIIPKGRPEKGRKAWQVAAQEAYEEAGLNGMISTKAVGSYQTVKRLKSGQEVPCTVRVFLFQVEGELDDWPERDQRDRQWLTVEEAAKIAGEPGLVELLIDFEALWRLTGEVAA